MTIQNSEEEIEVVTKEYNDPHIAMANRKTHINRKTGAQLYPEHSKAPAHGSPDKQTLND